MQVALRIYFDVWKAQMTDMPNKLFKIQEPTPTVAEHANKNKSIEFTTFISKNEKLCVQK